MKSKETSTKQVNLSFLFLTLYLCLVFFEPQQFYAGLREIRITYIFGIFVLFWSFLKAPVEVKRGVFRSWQFRTLSIFVVLCILSLLVSRYPIQSQYSDLLKAVSLFLMISFVIRSEAEFIKLCWVLLIFTATVSLVTIYYYHQGVLPTRMPSYFGGLGQSGSNEFALLMVEMLAFPLVILVYETTKVKKSVLILSVMMFMYCLTRTQSRSGLLGCVLVLLALIVLKYLRGKYVLGLLFIVAVLLVKTPGSYFERMDTMTDRTITTKDSNVSSRVEGYRNALNVIAEYPFLGIGLENYQRYAKLSIYKERDKIQTIHNTYLIIGAEAGIPSLIVFLCFVFGSLIRLKGVKKELEEDERLVGLVDATLIGILGYSLVACFQPVPWNRLLFIFAGMSVCLGNIINGHCEKKKSNS